LLELSPLAIMMRFVWVWSHKAHHTHTHTHTASYTEVVELEPLLPDMDVAAEKAVIARNDVKRETKIVLGPR